MSLLVDVLCVGRAAYDLTFGVDSHPLPDEKLFAHSLVSCGGGPAANAAVSVARLGGTAVFAGYLGHDVFGQLHLEELQAEGVMTNWIVRGASPTPVSTIIAKPDGQRTLIAYQGNTDKLPAGSIDFAQIKPKVILFDGHEPHLSLPLAAWARKNQIPTVLDAGSLHIGTERLAEHVDYLICSEKFARQYTGEQNEQLALSRLKEVAPFVAITLGERGLVWKNGQAEGHLPAFAVNASDTTGAGDTFHGAFAWCLSQQQEWLESLMFASAAAALCCTKQGARHGIPYRTEVEQLIKQHP
ncbi:MAG: carbohydrate kinase [Ardenticatenaceae bacterium]|nr:carbohydrate kinase [Ardenticatenaceae bacterium]